MIITHLSGVLLSQPRGALQCETTAALPEIPEIHFGAPKMLSLWPISRDGGDLVHHGSQTGRQGVSLVRVRRSETHICSRNWHAGCWRFDEDQLNKGGSSDVQ